MQFGIEGATLLLRAIREFMLADSLGHSTRVAQKYDWRTTDAAF